MIIYALAIHSGGGKVLLDHLIRTSLFGKTSYLICDSRYMVPQDLDPSIKIIRIKPTVLSRWRAEFLLKNTSQVNPDEDILCFSSLPPAFKLSSKTILYFQNALLLPGHQHSFNSLKTKLRITYEKLWFRLFLNNVEEIWVQTKWIQKSLETYHSSIKLKPFLPDMPLRNFKIEKIYDYITVSGNADHKKLYELLVEWKKLTNNPSLLVITEKPNKKIQELIETLTPKHNITLIFNATRSEIFHYYQQTHTLLISSTVESYCLPIYEALHFGLKVCALESEFTSEVSEIKFRFKNLTAEDISKIHLKIHQKSKNRCSK